MFQIKKLLGGIWSLIAYNAQISKTYTMIKALNKLAELSASKTKAIV
ncbi:hypothetical protein BTN50_1921 [Candidatus Enterovibrio altilux]|uniref:Mobile element protein n=1 Tax=Candidatus Enterovibrio altilux TaxID=1927128 RepID=A0A291BBG2_9GAMM|nr:hypothetical protein BTN50_1921 [Candidatus Enterovibrio luxaltus]